eukprot:scaffold4566_cov286-Chaetoceros_neogracile.AAC.1
MSNMPTRRNVKDAPKSELRPLTSDPIELSEDLSPHTSTLEIHRSNRSRPDLAPPIASPLSIAATSSVKRVNHWRGHDYAVGLVHPTWADELNHSVHSNCDSDTEANGPNRECCSDAGNREMDPTCGCLLISGHVCGRLGFKRIGNMIIVKERTAQVRKADGETVERQVFDQIIGPYWPMLFFVTYPLIMGVSLWTAKQAVFVPNFNPILIGVWLLFTGGLCLSLFLVSCKDPGILLKHHSSPEGETNPKWRWNDRAQSYVPRGAIYDDDCAVVVEEFDHTCPWTGTAIGKKNMLAFQAFIFFLFSSLIMDIILITSTSI